MQDKKKTVNIMPLMALMESLLQEEGGCPWDRAQTHDSLRKHVIEEACEVAEAIDDADMRHLCEELGDLLYQIVFHAALAERAGIFDMQDVIDAITQKMKRRHPHVFADETVGDVSEVWQSWDRIKQEENNDTAAVIMKDMPPALPALLKAQKFIDKAARLNCPLSIQTLTKDYHAISADLLSVVMNAHTTETDAEQVLDKDIRAIIRRFQRMERLLRQNHGDPASAGFQDWMAAWDASNENLYDFWD